MSAAILVVHQISRSIINARWDTCALAKFDNFVSFLLQALSIPSIAASSRPDGIHVKPKFDNFCMIINKRHVYTRRIHMPKLNFTIFDNFTADIFFCATCHFNIDMYLGILTIALVLLSAYKYYTCYCYCYFGSCVTFSQHTLL